MKTYSHIMSFSLIYSYIFPNNEINIPTAPRNGDNVSHSHRNPTIHFLEKNLQDFYILLTSIYFFYTSAFLYLIFIFYESNYYF